MTNERFIKKIISEVKMNFRKSEEQKDKELISLVIPYSKREYQRIENLLPQINERLEGLQIQPLKDGKNIRIKKVI